MRRSLPAYRAIAVACVFIVCGSTFAEGLPSQVSNSVQLGNRYYLDGRYDLARIEYDRARLLARQFGASDSDASARLSLALMRDREFHASLRFLNDESSFTHLYLRMYGALRGRLIHPAIFDQQRIDASEDFSGEEKEQARLLGGSFYLERADYEGAVSYFRDLQREAESEEVRLRSGRVLTALDNYDHLDRKSAILAGLFSTVLPGAGQVYSDHYADGAAAFFFNSVFLGGAIILYDLERRADQGHAASIGFGVVGLVFYLANITGAVQSARRYNQFHERRFHKEVRDIYFNIDYVERTSGITFTEEL